MTRIFLLLSILLLALTGCAQNAPAVQTVTDYDQLVAALKAAGATVEESDISNQPFFSAPGRRLVINGKNVDVHQYPDEAARQKESSTISPDGFGVGTSMVDWVDVPHFWAQGRLIVLYVGQDQPTIDLLSTLLGSPITRPPA